MDAVANARQPSPLSGRDLQLPRGLLCAMATGLGAGLTATAVLLTSRRVFGGLVEPLPVAGLCAVGVVAAGIGCLLRLYLGSDPTVKGTLSPRSITFLGVVTSVPLFTIAASLSISGTSYAGLAALWAPVSIEGLFMLAWLVRRGDQRPRITTDTATNDLIHEARMHVAPVDEVEHEFAPEITQHIQRGSTDDAGDSCYGWLRAKFQPGQRTETVHVAFCPPFLQTPKLHVEQLEGPTTQIKLAQVLPYGARLELRLAEASQESVETIVGFSAFDTPDQHAA